MKYIKNTHTQQTNACTNAYTHIYRVRYLREARENR